MMMVLVHYYFMIVYLLWKKSLLLVLLTSLEFFSGILVPFIILGVFLELFLMSPSSPSFEPVIP